MSSRTAQQATAASLATIATLAMLIGLQGLAAQPHAEATMARSATPAATQVVIVTGQRIARS